MAVVLLQLSLFVVTVIQLTSSQSTYDATRQDNDVISCGRTEQVLSHLVSAVSQLQQEVGELKALVGNKDAKLEGRSRHHNSQAASDFSSTSSQQG